MTEQETAHAINADDLARNVNLEHRRKVVSWLVKAFHVVNFDDAILFGTVQLADRHLVRCGRYVSGSHLQGIVMACLCTTLKLQTADSLIYSVPTLLAHITHDQISLDRVLKVEREVLAGVEFSVTVPTIQNFLDVLAVRCMAFQLPWDGLATVPVLEAVVGGPAEVRPKFWHLADFIAQLTLLEHTCSGVPGSLVASAALILSLWTLDAPHAFKTALLEDIGLARHNASRLDEVQLLVSELQDRWRAAVTQREEASPSLPVVEKFAQQHRHEVSNLPVPVQPIRFR
jgi:hypothetical protein